MTALLGRPTATAPAHARRDRALRPWERLSPRQVDTGVLLT